MSSFAHLSIRRLALNRGGRWLFRDLDWEIVRGTFAAIVGPSGAGKSSLLGCLAGLTPPDEGTCAYASNSTHFSRRIGMVFQDYRLAGNNNVLLNVLCGRLGRYSSWRTLTGFPTSDRIAALDLLADLGLSRCAGSRVRDISGGERQRVALARALFQEADLLLADEPVSNLDPTLALRVMERLRTEAHEHGRTVLCVLHDPELVAEFADETLQIDAAGTWKLTPRHAAN